MRSLVIGGTGFLGANLVRTLLEHGHAVRVLHRPSSQTGTIEGLNIERMVGDLCDGESLRRACQGVEVVYHTAGYYPTATIPVDMAKGQALKETVLILEAVRATGVNRFVYASTLTTIGFPKIPGHPATESCPFTTRYRHNPYLMAKAAMEEKILHSAQQGIPAVVVIPTQCFGPYDQRPTSGTQILMVAKRRMPVYLEGRVNVIDVRDVAVAMMRAAERGREGERYLVGNWNTTQKDLNECIAQVADVMPPLLPVPFALARWGARIGERLASGLMRRQPVIPAFVVELMAHMQHYDCSKAQRELAYPQSSPEKAIEDALDWFRRHQYLSS